MELRPGQTLSHYRLIDRIGIGGMGVVYRALDTTLDRHVALKVLPPEVTADPDRLERFRREAKAAAALNHPNIVTIHSVEEAAGVHFMTLELVDGQTLDTLIPASGLPPGRFFDLAIPLAEGVSAAHEKGIVHRDLKPQNVMVTPGGIVKVLDFGLARLARPEGAAGVASLPTQTATREGQILGTVPYMSPEQVQGKPVDHRTDIFSLGILFYEMAVGHRPFAGGSAAELASAILRDTPVPPTELRADLPPLLGRIIRRCLEKDPARRYQTALDVRNELEDLRAETRSPPGGAPPAGAGATGSAATPSAATVSVPGIHAPRVSVASRAAVAAIMVAVIAAAAAGGWVLWRTKGGAVTPAAPGAAAAPAPAAAGPLTSVAIMPFLNMSDDKENEYFSDGMTEELINALVQVHDLKVPARTTVFAYKGKNLDVQEIGRRLGVDTVLEGSVRRQGETIRVTAQLIKVADGYHLWSEHYDRQMKDVFAIQDEIARNIVKALQVALGPGEAPASHPGATTDVRAYDLYLKGRKLFDLAGRRNWGAAREMFQRAIDIDPGYVQAWSGVTWAAGFLYMYAESTEANLEQAKTASARALALAPESADAHAARGLALMLGRQYDEADREFATANRLDPKNWEAWYFRARSFFAQGKLEEAAAYFRKAMEIRPEDYQAPALLTGVLSGLGRTTEAAAETRRTIDLARARLEVEPDDVRALYMGAGALVQLGEVERGIEWAQRAVAIEPNDSGTLYNIACLYSRAGRPDEAIDFLERALKNGFAQKEWILHDSDLDAVRADPRFRQLVAGMK